jgi:nicotinic acid phosphoribosyltransferase
MKTAYKRLHPEHHIINYLTAIDCYKYSMGQLYLHKHPNARARWDFKIRSKTMCPDESRIEEVKRAFNYRSIDEVQEVCQ